jgi:hypothetical protein
VAGRPWAATIQVFRVVKNDLRRTSTCARAIFSFGFSDMRDWTLYIAGAAAAISAALAIGTLVYLSAH